MNIIGFRMRGQSMRLHMVFGKELSPVVISAAVWGDSWIGKTVTGYSENQAVVAVLNIWSC